jgi:hypothetical protein
MNSWMTFSRSGSRIATVITRLSSRMLAVISSRPFMSGPWQRHAAACATAAGPEPGTGHFE